MIDPRYERVRVRARTVGAEPERFVARLDGSRSSGAGGTRAEALAALGHSLCSLRPPWLADEDNVCVVVEGAGGWTAGHGETVGAALCHVAGVEPGGPF